MCCCSMEEHSNRVLPLRRNISEKYISAVDTKIFPVYCLRYFTFILLSQCIWRRRRKPKLKADFVTFLRLSNIVLLLRSWDSIPIENYFESHIQRPRREARIPVLETDEKAAVMDMLQSMPSFKPDERSATGW